MSQDRTARPGRTATVSRPRGRVVAALAAALLGSTAGLGIGAASAAEATVDDATLVWGLNGYAQRGIFGPWTFKNLTGNVEQLVGSVSGGSQTEYLVDPVPATSMPTGTSGPQTPNAVKFTGGTGTVDAATGASSLTWSGSYTVNAYPPAQNAPNEIYANPQLTVNADGSGALSFEFTLGAGVDMSGNPVAEQDFGRLTVVAFGAGAVGDLTDDGYRLTPGYQGVEVSPESLADPSAVQVRSCTAESGATGWWGSWAPEFVEVLPSSIRQHFYSTGCGGLQDNKPPLPVDVGYAVDAPVTTPTVHVSQTQLDADGTSDIVVTGEGFPQTSATGTPGVYVAVGPQIGETWWTSASAFQYAKYVRPSFTGEETASGATLNADGTFTVHFENVAPVYTTGETTYDASVTPFAVLTFATQGSSDRSLDTVTPLTFVDGEGLDIIVDVPGAPGEPGEPGAFVWTIDGGVGAVSLGTAVATASGFSATGNLPTISVTDTRAEAPAWSIAGQVSDFTASGGASFGGQALGWAPTVTENTVDALAGVTVAPGTGAGDGLRSSATLASSAAGHAKGSVAIDAQLTLLAPIATPAGSYTATLPLTALS